MNTKAKGSRRERPARKLLEATGHYVVKAGGSLGLFDLVALGPTGARLIQVKSNEKPRSAERERLEHFPRFPFAKKELWVFYDRVRDPSIEILI
jgi:Holliday junction resolvase